MAAVEELGKGKRRSRRSARAFGDEMKKGMILTLHR